MIAGICRGAPLAGAVALAVLSGCAGAGGDGAGRAPPPAPGAPWDWQLSEPLDPPLDVATFDTDPESITPAQMAALKEAGIYTICYVSVGTVEDYRADAERFPPAVVGRSYPGWPGEKFLDIRRIDVLLPIMRDRFARCKALGFDAIEADNMDVYMNDSGFAITREDTVAYVTALADAAHEMGLGIGQKNVPALTGRLVGRLDFAITESCYQDGWCGAVRAYARAGKPVFDAEYTDRPIDFSAACAMARKYDISMILKDRDLHEGGRRCPN